MSCLARLIARTLSERAANRSSTTTALQSLSMLNGMFINQQAGFLADRVRGMAPGSPEQQVKAAFELAFGRPPTPIEVTAASALVRSDGLAILCRGLYNANEFLYY